MHFALAPAPHSDWLPDAQAHCPPRHTWPAEHLVSQLPQLLRSVVKSTQLPPHCEHGGPSIDEGPSSIIEPLSPPSGMSPMVDTSPQAETPTRSATPNDHTYFAITQSRRGCSVVAIARPFISKSPLRG
jgi:hypothetical protein